MDDSQATEAERLNQPSEVFRSVAKDHRADVARVRERARRTRLLWVLAIGLVILAYALKRAFEGNPFALGWPQLGPDAFLYLMPIGILLLIGMVLLLPMLVNGKSPHIRFSPEEIRINFSDVKGLDIVLEEVTRSLQIFLTYKTFRDELGGNPRRGILFEGPPGTGKTHMAKAMAAEAGVPFLFISGPALHSMWSGMTAFRIRAYFRALKKAARKEGGAIGFIEEMDAIGGARAGMNAFTEYREGMGRLGMVNPGGQEGTVNELLLQLQSFDTPPLGQRTKNLLIDLANKFMPTGLSIKKRPTDYSNILVIAATNRAGALDPALMRPGRFDRTLYFDLPSKSGRRELIDYFLERRTHAEEMDRDDLREELSAMTLGYSPAKVEHIFDEALVWALREGRRELNWRDVQRARLSEEIGIAQPVAYTDRERDLIATHEAGHAVAAYLFAKDWRKLEVLSIIKRRQALGLLAHSDVEERFTKTKSELESTIRIALGGMCAEEIFFGEHGTGPSNDLVAATSLAAQMVGSFGMGRSLISYEAVQNGAHSAPNIVAKVLTNDETKREVEDMLFDQRNQVRYQLERNRDLIEALRDSLLDKEELLGDDIRTVLEKTLTERN